MNEETKSLIHVWLQLLQMTTVNSKGQVVPLLEDDKRIALAYNIMMQTGILTEKKKEKDNDVEEVESGRS